MILIDIPLIIEGGKYLYLDMSLLIFPPIEGLVQNDSRKEDLLKLRADN